MIYLDAAATTLEKPPEVRWAVARAMHTMSSPGRGGHEAARLAEETAYQCRCEAAELFDVASPERVIFTSNATHGLNIAIRSVVKPGMRVVISGYEHNAVTRPLCAIPGVERVIIDTPLFDRAAMAEEFWQAIEDGAEAVICNHVSNVFGSVQPVEEIAAMCRKAGVPFILDASQSAGVLPVRLGKLGAAYVAMPGHKGLYGPQGTGLLLVGEGQRPEPVLQGGTGSVSRQQSMPEELPDRLEAGTHNMPGIAGLLEGLRYVRKTGLQAIAAHEREVIQCVAGELEHMPGVEIFRAGEEAAQVGVLSFRVQGREVEEVAQALGRRGIAVRAGLHCAPLAHRSAGTLETGTVRVSVSSFTQMVQAKRFTADLSDILRENSLF